MSQSLDAPDRVIAPPEPAPPRRGRLVYTLLAWLVILGLAGFVVYVQNVVRPKKEPAGNDDRLGILLVQMQARYLVAAESFAGRNPSLATQAEALNAGPLDRRLRAIVLVGEFSGPKSALEQLAALDEKLARHQIELDATQQAVRDALYRLYQDYEKGDWSAPSLTPQNRGFLRTQLGWFGSLALAPGQGPDPGARAEVLASAYRTFWVIVVFVLGLLALGFLGLLGLFVLLICWGVGVVRGGLGGPTAHGGVYAETFALWMVTYVALGVAAAVVPLPVSRALLSGVAMVISLVVLGWPILRGIPWRQVRQDVGLTAGASPALEPVVGAGCYALAIPLLAVGVVLMLVLMEVEKSRAGTVPPSENFGSETGVRANPAIEYLIAPGWWSKVEVLLLACVVAPVVEETMFRGVLYRQLRDGTHRLGGVISALVSATVVNFIFAAVHPQGLVAIPALMMLAYALALAREWRGSLVPGMVMHGVNNGVILTFFLLAMGN